ncbi:hypothetical protein CLV30_11387 [Haloactinopolyspora alba]|uniref:WD40 repeat protein n=1 Tax=Haloactinopolyspora alba TaxID=648780 RepID=A0A2P8DWJ5_9ACTN|nr:hypothetical protein [Haloactinopolyspora alba]PSL01599.1 hypothetical protein CLV30_11387 [Haloactinopolyspora alba]
MKVEDTIRENVDHMTRAVHPRTGLADDAIRQAHTSRRRVRIAVAGSTAAVAGLGAFLVVDPGGLRDGFDTPAANAPLPAASDTRIDFDDLPLGSPPEVPWLADGAIHDVSGSTSFGVDVSAVSIRRVDGGHVVKAVPPADAPFDDVETVPDWPHARLFFVPQDGEATVLAEGRVTTVAVSPSGKRVAWGMADLTDASGDFNDQDDMRSSLTVADVRTGEVIDEITEIPAMMSSPAGFLGEDRVLYASDRNKTPLGTFLWEIGGDTSRWRDGGSVVAVSASAGLAAVRPRGGPTEIVGVESGEVLWSVERTIATPLDTLAFSPDGQYAAIVENTHVVIRDARTGEEVRRIMVETPEHPRWESDDSLVFGAYQDTTQAALVRCPVEGDCELATEPRQLDDDPHTRDNPYRLGT